jgi:hypothetical protein
MVTAANLTSQPAWLRSGEHVAVVVVVHAVVSVREEPKSNPWRAGVQTSLRALPTGNRHVAACKDILHLAARVVATVTGVIS